MHKSLASLSLAFLLASCGGGQSGAKVDDLSGTEHDDLSVPVDLAVPFPTDFADETFSNDVMPILEKRGCLECHMTDTWDNGEAKSGAALVTFLTSTMSSECPSLPYITAGNTANSYLYQKITGQGSCFTGDAMPKGSGPLDAAETAIIAAWITQGAQSN